MRRAITHAALTFSLLSSSAGLAQATGGGSAAGTASGGAQGTYYEPGNFTPPPQLTPSNSGGTPMGTIETNTGAEPPAAPPAGATRGNLLEPATGGSGQQGTPAANVGGIGGAGVNAPSAGTAGTGQTASSDTTGTFYGSATGAGTGTGGSNPQAGATTSGSAGTGTGGSGTQAGAATSGSAGTGTGGSGTQAGAATSGATDTGTVGNGTQAGAATSGATDTGTVGNGTQAGAATSGAAGSATPQAANLSGDTTTAARAQQPENLEQEVARLREQVQRLEREVDTLRSTGTGGSGTQATASDADVGSTVLASVVMQGRVASVGKDRVVVRDAESGDTFNLFVTNTTRISANGRRVSPQQLTEGTPVQAAFNYIADGDTYATQIQAYPSRSR